MIAHKPDFYKFWNLGYKNLVPVVPPDAPVSEKSTLARRLSSRGKAVGIKGNDGLWRGYDWLNAKPTTTEDLERWSAMGAGVGIRTGSGLVAVDIDTLDSELALTASNLANSILGRAPIRTGRYPKRLLVYRTEPGSAIPYQRVEFTGHEGKQERIELLSDGRQFVADGIHASTGKPYRWSDELPVSGLPVVTQAQLDTYFRTLAEVLPAAQRAELNAPADRAHIDQTHLIGDIDHVRQAVLALPNEQALFPTYDDYIRVGAAIKGATQSDPELGRELFVDWASRYDGDNGAAAETAAADYDRIKPPYGIGASFLYDLATQHGQFNPANVWFDDIHANDDDLWPAQHTNDRQYKFLTFEQSGSLALKASHKPLIKGLLTQNAMTVLYGESNVGKTFVALDIAFHIATGLPYATLKTYPVPVVYVVAEGGMGIHSRVAALIHKHGPASAHAPIQILPSPIDLLRPDADVKPLANALAAMQPRPGFVVLDTLSRVMAGGDENSSVDMGALVKHFDHIRMTVGCHLLAVHHTGKDKARGARGHSLLRAATDTEIEVSEGLVSVTKQRDLPKGFSTGFRLESVLLGEDLEGDAVVSCTVALCSPEAAALAQQGEDGGAGARVAPTATEAVVLRVLGLMEGEGTIWRDGVSLDDLFKFIQKDKLSDMSKDTTRSHLRALIAKGHVEKSKHGIYKVIPEGQSVRNGVIMSSETVEKASTVSPQTVDDIFG